MSISILNPHLGMWTQLEPPGLDHPFWRESDDGTRRHLREILAGLEPERAAEIERLHAEAIGRVAAGACEAWRAGHTRRARALARAATRLSEEIVGFWPVDASQRVEDLIPPAT